ncbi:SMP-30/gluconolactonase/LRE family protein [Flavihumibacter sp. UBA7668]|uniref:SMP-30/gluconolactonase/LRE family protein n=1 Tax=Flavihumibacter sp. UBA7668 TaxID=1946542 RepID=UPI0025C4482D|nr:SMP-30/gluconolactonase/LRE family protein [Flavihumibacter sp. UBA7668]
MKATVLYTSGCQLGESPLWHAGRKSCFWVDIEGRSFYEGNWEQGNICRWQMDSRVSLLIEGERNQLILGIQGGVVYFNLQSGRINWVTKLDTNWAGYRCNDGGSDAKGRIWVSTIDLAHREGKGSLYLVYPDGGFEKKLSGLSIPNGMVWSPDNKRLYFVDSITREVYSYLYEHKNSDLTLEKAVIRIPPDKGLPDGMAMDSEGMLWVALWGGFGVGRFNPATGEMLSFVEVPAPQVSSCAFVGEHLNLLMITTARTGLDASTLQQYPNSGHVFIVNPGVTGAPVFSCRMEPATI